jgi:hypothetical protein
MYDSTPTDAFRACKRKMYFIFIALIKENKTVPEKLATTLREDGHKQNTKTSTTIWTKRTVEHRTTGEEMEGPNSS